MVLCENISTTSVASIDHPEDAERFEEPSKEDQETQNLNLAKAQTHEKVTEIKSHSILDSNNHKSPYFRIGNTMVKFQMELNHEVYFLYR